jgi:hypothetical protein
MSIYLWLNAALYLGFAAWCTFSPWRTAGNIGYTMMSSGGRSEYLVIYGGLQLGLAAIFALFARGDVQVQRLGLQLALCLYAPIVVYRLVTVAKFWPIPGLTLAVGSLELALLVAAAALLARAAP